MLKTNNKPNKLIIVLHEIYGVNQHMSDFCEFLSKQHFHVICPNLLERRLSFDYSEKERAYRHFMSNVGFTSAFHKVKSVLLDNQDKYSKIFIIGFSVGATIAWMCSEEKAVDGIVGYYGSRIRDYISINPNCPVMLFFPRKEASFNIDELISTLHIQNIDARKCKGEHGFSDPYSPMYDEDLTKHTYWEVLQFLKAN